jgi:SH3 domain protein
MGLIKISRLKLLLLFVLFIFLSILVGSTHADTRYVSDMLIVTLREGRGLEYKAIRAIKTGTPMEVLEESGRYLRVRIEEGEEGWIAKKYISSEVPKAIIIAGLKKEANRLKTRVKELEKGQASLLDQINVAKRGYTIKVEELEKSAKNSREEASRITMELAQITEKYNTLLDQSKNVVELISEHERFQKEKVRLDKEMKDLVQENAHLKNKRMIGWFLAGGGVFFIGFIAGKVSRKKRYY